MYVGLAAMLLNVTLNLTLIWPLGGRGLAISTALVASTQCVVTCWLALQRINSGHIAAGRQIAVTLSKTIIAVVAMSGVCLFLNQSVSLGTSFLMRASLLFVPLTAGLCTFFGAAWLVGLQEPWMLLLPKAAFDMANEPEAAKAPKNGFPIWFQGGGAFPNVPEDLANRMPAD